MGARNFGRPTVPLGEYIGLAAPETAAWGGVTAHDISCLGLYISYSAIWGFGARKFIIEVSH